MGITTWTKPCHRSVHWSRCSKVLCSLGYKMLGKDNVLLLRPKLKEQVPEISPCLTAWMRFTLSDLFFPLENGLLLVHFKLGSSRIIPEVPPTHLREDMRDLPRGSEACRFLLRSDCQGYVCSWRQWAMDDSSVWRAKNKAWLTRMVTLTLSPLPKSRDSLAVFPHGNSWWHLLSVRSCLNKSRRTVRAKPILWVGQHWCGQPQTRLVHVLQSYLVYHVDMAWGVCRVLSFLQTCLSQWVWGHLCGLKCSIVLPLGSLEGSRLYTSIFRVIRTE